MLRMTILNAYEQLLTLTCLLLFKNFEGIDFTSYCLLTYFTLHFL